MPLAPRSRGCGTPPASCCRVVSQWRQKAVYRAVSCTGLKIACVFRKGVDRVFVDHALFLERVRQAFSAMKRASARASKNDSTPLNPIMCVSHHYTATRCRTVIEIPSTVLHRAVPRPHRAQRNQHGTRAGRRCRHGACARARAPAARTRGRIPSSDLHSGLRQRAFCQRCSITASQARAHMHANMLHLSPNQHQRRRTVQPQTCADASAPKSTWGPSAVFLPTAISCARRPPMTRLPLGDGVRLHSRRVRTHAPVRRERARQRR